MKRTISVVVAAVLIAGCASRSAAPSPVEEMRKPEAAAPAFDIEKMFARELPEMAKQKFSVGDLTAESEGAAAPNVTPGEQSVTIGVPLAGASALNCILYKHDIDPGGALLNVITAVAKEVEVQQVRPTDIAVVEQTPAVFLEMQYLVRGEKGNAAGQLKMMVLASDSVPLLCLHDEVGYQQSFKRITLGLASSLVAQRPAAARYALLMKYKLGELPVGFELERHLDGQNGATVVSHLSTLFVPRSPTDLIVEDSVSTVVSDKSGRMMSLEYAKAVNGELEVRISATREKNGEYSYKGQHSGKQIAGRFKPKDRDGLPTSRGVARAMKEKLLAGKASEVRFEEYLPEVNPAGPVETIYAKTDKAPRAVSATLREMTLEQILDEQGYAERVEISMGPASLVGERILTHGAP